jgi:hypothetical protein
MERTGVYIRVQSFGMLKVILITSAVVMGIPTPLMTRGIMVEIYRYVGKCIDGNCVIKFYEAI